MFWGVGEGCLIVWVLSDTEANACEQIRRILQQEQRYDLYPA